VDAAAQGERADRAILSAMEKGAGEWLPRLETPAERPACSRSRLQKLIEDGHATVDGLPAKANLKLREGAKIRVEFPLPKALEVSPENLPVDILFQDEHLVIVNKPPGLTVHPSETQSSGTLVNILLHHIRDLSGIGGVLRPGIVHRIDKDTSGALVITKTDRAHQALAEIFSRHDIERVYEALCFGAPLPGGTAGSPIRVEGNIGRSPTDRKKMAILPEGGRNATSLFHKKEEYRARPGKDRVTPAPFASFLEVRLETGRTHQIRVHLTSIGHSLLGDPTYGKPGHHQPKWLALPEDAQKAVSEMPGQALHAATLGFDHPITGARLRFEAPRPPGFTRLLEALRKYRESAS
jgi:23S rRNA pseudouridine1911/1915/1917 synthase